MVSERKPVKTDRDLLRIVLDVIWDKGEVMESDLYPLISSHKRIRPILEELSRGGILKIRERDFGQRAKMYSFTEKGKLYFLLNRISNGLLESNVSLDPESGEYTEIFNTIKERLGIELGKSESEDVVVGGEDDAQDSEDIMER